MEFKDFNIALQKHIAKICKDEKHLFVIELDKDKLWNLYLDSFPPGTNKIFRENREFDCNCCKQFIRAFGNVVNIKNNQIITIWDFKVDDEKYQIVINALSKFIKSQAITDVLITDTHKFGTVKSHMQGENEVITWYHYHVNLPTNIQTYPKDKLGTVRGEFRNIRNVFARSLNEILEDSVETVLELIAQKSLYKGEEWKEVLQKFLKLQKQYNKLSTVKKKLYTWKQSTEAGPVIGKIRNHSIGTLLINISEGIDLNLAVKKYEAIVAPTNYKRPKTIFTKKMVAAAQKKIEDLGLTNSLSRRFATLDDITVNNILFVNRDVRGQLGGNSVFDDLISESKAIVPKKFNKLEEVDIDTFIQDIVPSATDIELLLENKHMGNMISLIAPKDIKSPTLFKWNNSFCWAYKGNITDSMKERVKAAGGKVDGVLRFSIQWNDKNDNPDDLDAHCFEPKGNLIYFSNMRNQSTGGNLDVDIQHPRDNVAVENITWPSISHMENGKYTFLVHNYAYRGSKSGFTAQIEFDGKIHSFSYPNSLYQSQKITVAEVTLKDGEFSIKESLPSSISSQNIWNLTSNNFHPVSICMYSPNYWDEQKGIGHRHYLFMLKDCKNNENPNGFFNEFLREEFMEYKRVFEALGTKMNVPDSDTQLSGLGFSATKRADFICKVKGKFERMLKVKI